MMIVAVCCFRPAVEQILGYTRKASQGSRFELRMPLHAAELTTVHLLMLRGDSAVKQKVLHEC